MGSHSRGPREEETISRRAVALSRESDRGGLASGRSRSVGRQNTPFPSSFYFSSGPSFPRFLISTLHLPPLHSGGPFSPFGSNSSRCQTNKKRTRGVDMPRPISPSSNSSDRSPLFLFKHFPPFPFSYPSPTLALRHLFFSFFPPHLTLLFLPFRSSHKGERSLFYKSFLSPPFFIFYLDLSSTSRTADFLIWGP